MDIKIVEVDADNEYESQKLSIDNEIDITSSYYSGGLGLKNSEVIEKISGLTINELRKYFDSVSFPYDQRITVWPIEVNLQLKKEVYTHDSEGYPISSETIDLLPSKIMFEVNVDVRNWNKEYTIDEVSNLYGDITSQYEGALYSTHETELFGSDKIGIFTFEVKDEDQTLAKVLKDFLIFYEKINLFVLNALPKSELPDIFTTLFEFPEELKIACKQYLIYFAQFLADIGINADTSIKEEANKVLFTVISNNGDEALIKIKAALEIYMNAPGNPDIETIVSNETKDVAVLQWEANIYHLKGQISLQQAVLQAKNATIEALQLSNYRLKEEIATAKQIEEKVSGLKEEKFMGGTVAIKKYDGKWFSIDLPEFIRKLKRKK